MARNSRKGLQQRRLQFMAYLEDSSRTGPEIMEHLDISQRLLQEDIKYFKEHYPGNFIKESLSGDGRKERATYTWTGVKPWTCAEPLTWITDRECMALSAAIQFFKNNTDEDDSESLGHVLEELFQRMDIPDDAIPPRPIIEISSFGVEDINHHALQVCMHAISGNTNLKFHYRSLHEAYADESGHERHVVPIRVQLIQSEWYLIAWHNRVVTYKVARIKDPRHTSVRPKKAPAHIEDQFKQNTHDNIFYATGGDTEEYVSIQFHKDLLPHLRNRIWGRKTLITKNAKDFDQDHDENWYRLSFYTKGITQCRYWILSFAENMYVEKPQSLADWVKDRHSAAEEMY